MENFKVWAVVFLSVLLAGVGVVSFQRFVLQPNGPQGIGTELTQQTSNSSYTDSADWRQNLQAIAEKMAGRTEGQVLQADSQGRMQPVAISALTNQLELTEAVSANNTITLSESAKTFYLSGATSTQTLPASSTAAGAVYRFVIAGSVTGNITIVTSDGGNDIEGTLIVAGAVVDCDAEDTLTFVADGENVGDFVELRSNGSKWFIGESGALTASKLTCTAT